LNAKNEDLKTTTFIFGCIVMVFYSYKPQIITDPKVVVLTIYDWAFSKPSS